MLKSHKLKIVPILATVLALGGLLTASSVQAVPFMGKIDMITGYGLPIPIAGGWVEYGVANVIPNALYPSNPDISFPSTNFQINEAGVHFPAQPTSYPFITSSTFLDSALDAGTFSGGAGPGAISFCGGNTTHLCGVNPGPTNQSGERSGWIRVPTPGPNQFGGVIPLLNQGPNASGFRNRVHIQSGPGQIIGTFPVPMNMFGNNTSVNIQRTSIFSHTTLGFTVPLSIHLQGMPWTTGQVVASDNFGIVASVQTATGYDTRTASGNDGSIQLVSASLYHTGGLTADDGTVMAQLRLTFVPEPSATNMLRAGLIALPLLYMAGGVLSVPLLRRKNRQ